MLSNPSSKTYGKKAKTPASITPLSRQQTYRCWSTLRSCPSTQLPDSSGRCGSMGSCIWRDALLPVLKSTSPFDPLMPTHSICAHWKRTSSRLTSRVSGHGTQFPWANAVQDQPDSRPFEEVHKPQSVQHHCPTAVPGWSRESGDNVCDWAQM